MALHEKFWKLSILLMTSPNIPEETRTTWYGKLMGITASLHEGIENVSKECAEVNQRMEQIRIERERRVKLGLRGGVPVDVQLAEQYYSSKWAEQHIDLDKVPFKIVETLDDLIAGTKEEILVNLCIGCCDTYEECQKQKVCSDGSVNSNYNEGV